jgi:tetratricopeptide (TPR) repeat protein
VPRPDLSVSIRTPDACTGCHAGRTADWAAQALAAWFPGGRQKQPHYGTALHAGRIGAANAEMLLDRLILDTAEPAIVRASALLLLSHNGTAASAPAVNAAIVDPDPLVRLAAPRAFSAATPPATLKASVALLEDRLRAVRIEAARALTGFDPRAMTSAQQGAYTAAYRELVAAEMVDADRPEAHLNTGLLDLRRGRPAEAETEYRTALRLDPRFVPALVNLADLDRMTGRDQQGAELLRQAIAIEPNNADVHYALGLYLVRQHNYAEALPLLSQASVLAPDNAHYAYVYAIALNSRGNAREAIALLQRAHQLHPADWEVLRGLVLITRDAGDIATALGFAREMVALRPADPELGALVRDLEDRQAR